MERPILFSTLMVRAILDGRKSQTRRIIKKQPHGAGEWVMRGINWLFPNVNPYINLKCPYGKVGDILWVRETFAISNTITERDSSSGEILSEKKHYVFRGQKQPHIEKIYKWKPSIHMPKEACRIRLEITNIRVERVQEISQFDAVREGIESSNEFSSNEGYLHQYKDYIIGDFALDAICSYQTLWSKINGKDSWQSNPWVWVIEFKKL